MKKILFIIGAYMLIATGSAYAYTYMLSFQIGSSPSNGFVLETDGMNSTWVATSTLGFAASGGGGTGPATSTNPLMYTYGVATSTVATSTFAGPVQIGTAVANATSTLTMGDAGLLTAGCINIITQTALNTYATSSIYINPAQSALVVESHACK